MIKALFVPAQIDAPLELMDIDERDPLTYRQLVGGDLEVVTWSQPPAHMYLDEHGKLDRLPANLRATALWWMHEPATAGEDTVAGPALIVGPASPDEYDTDVSADLITLLMRSSAYSLDIRRLGDRGWRRWPSVFGDWLEAYTAAIHTMRRIGPAADVRVVPADDTVYPQRAAMSGHHNDGITSAGCGPRDSVPPTPAIRVSLEIENLYPGDVVIYTRVDDQVVAAPPADADEARLYDWAIDHLFPFTGTGRVHGDAWYEVTVTASTDERLLGQRFDFG